MARKTTAKKKKASRKKATRKKRTSKKKVASTKATRKRTAKKSKKKTATKQKPKPKKRPKKKPKKKPTKKARKTTPGKRAAKKASKKKKKTAKKKAGKKKVSKKVGKKKSAEKTKKKPARRKRVTRMTLEGALISLATLESEWPQLEWLQGIVLYGLELRSADVHRELSFVVVYDGIKTPAQMRKARRDIDALIKRAAPIRRQLNFIDDSSILDRIRAENPAVEALLGQAIVIWAR